MACFNVRTMRFQHARSCMFCVLPKMSCRWELTHCVVFCGLLLSSDGRVCVGRAVEVNRPDGAAVLRGCYCHHLQSVLLECGESLYLHLFSFKGWSGCVYEVLHDLFLVSSHNAVMWAALSCITFVNITPISAVLPHLNFKNIYKL